ncbi:MAG: glycosyltransferase family 4 protein [Chloroflexi bacterium]|nr:glycosyltransferase family 4 protein [Chloroflexota bacterium]
MRIAVDYSAALNQGAGIGRYTRCLIGALAELDRANEYVLFYAPQRGKRQKLAQAPLPGYGNFHGTALPLTERSLGIVWHRLGLPVPVDLLVGRFDLLYSPNFVLPPSRHGATMLTVHDLSFVLFPECADSRLVAYLQRVVPPSVARADLVLADSHNTKNDIVCLLDVPPERVEVVHLGVEPHFRRVTTAERLDDVRRRLELERPFLLSVGVVEPRKNYVRLIEAFARLRAEGYTDHELLIVGRRGWLSDDTYDRARELELDDHVRFLGHVDEADLPALYSLADVFVYPSLYEGFGLPPLEAMACGTPVVCSRSSSLPEVVGDAALLVTPTDIEELVDALRRVLDDTELRRDLGERGQARAATFSWPAAASQFLDLYGRVAPLP